MTPVTEFPKAHGWPSVGFISGRRGVIGMILLFCIARAIFPGDVPWIQDEPALIANALRANQEHRLAEVGLTGTLGRPYGPLPTWIYQALLLITHDLRIIVAIRGVGAALLTAIGLVLLADGAQLWLPFAAITMLSPHLWIYGRTLWDNSFNIPLAAIALGAYSLYLRRQSAPALLLAFAVALIMPFVHLMAIALTTPMMLHMLTTSRRALARWWPVTTAIVLAILGIHWRYLSLLMHSASTAAFSPAPSAWTDVLAGPRHISALGLYHFFDQQWTWGENPLFGMVFDAITAPSGIVFLFAAIGTGVTLQNRKTVPVGVLCLWIIAAQFALAFVTRAVGQPHYLNATWISYACLAWIGITHLIRKRWAQAMVALYGASLLATLLFIVIRVHATAGVRNLTFGTTLGEQLRAAQEINHYAPTVPLMRRPFQFWKFPQALEVLMELQYADRTHQANSLELRYATTNSWDAHVTVIPH